MPMPRVRFVPIAVVVAMTWTAMPVHADVVTFESGYSENDIVGTRSTRIAWVATARERHALAATTRLRQVKAVCTLATLA
jgi:hypothetical protein